MSVRRVLDRGTADRPRLGDVVGDLLVLDATTALIETRTGPVEVPLELITIARLVPASTADELALEAVAARGLRAAETGELGGWLLRADHGFTRRANSVLPLRAPGLPLDEALGQAHEWYAQRGLPLRLHVPVEARRLLDADLGERGWEPDYETHVMITRLATRRPAGEGSPAVQLADLPDDGWLTVYRGGAGVTPTGRALLTRHDSAVYASLRLAGQVVAVGRGALDAGWLGVMAVEVDPAHRRAGLAGAVMAALSDWGAAHGAVRGYLQVGVENVAAVRLYGKLGYWVHHDYLYRTEPAATAP